MRKRSSLLGCTIEYFNERLESRFKPGGAKKFHRPEKRCGAGCLTDRYQIYLPAFKNLASKVLLEDIKYFFYITNHTAYCAEKIVALANGRCDQENVIEQLKNGVNAMRMPVDDLLSNWAYM